MIMQSGRQQQGGIALIIALLFLGVVTIISVVAAKNSAVSLQVSGNMRDASDSFQAAEAGVFAALSLASGANDPFQGDDELTPFAGMDVNSEHLLRNLNDGAGSVDVDILLTSTATLCPRVEDASSVSAMSCEYYHISSEHSVAKKARTEVHLGVIRERLPEVLKEKPDP